MTVKMVSFATFLLFLTACAVSEVESTASNNPPDTSEKEPANEAVFFSWGEEDAFPDNDSLLAYREWGCSLGEAKRIQQLRARRGGTDPVSVKAALMLASCAPDKNPGILIESLEAARNLEGTSESFGRLVSLLEDNAKSYRVVEQRLEQKQARLQELVKGILEIEDQMRLSEDGEARQ